MGVRRIPEDVKYKTIMVRNPKTGKEEAHVVPDFGEARNRIRKKH